LRKCSKNCGRIELLNPLLTKIDTAVYRSLSLLFVAACIYLGNEVVLGFRCPGTGADWPDAMLVLLAAATTLMSMARRLPWQNVMLAATIVASIGGLAAGVTARTGFPFGVADGSAAPGLKLLGALPWAIPLIWVIALLNARGVGQLILWRRRQSETYGFQLLGLTILLVVLFDCGLESFATRVESYWAWKSPPVMEWYGAPLRCLVGCAAVTLLALVFSLPALMDKKPTPPLRNYQPLAIWVLLNLLCVTGAVVHRFWAVAGLVTAATFGIAFFALRGGSGSGVGGLGEEWKLSLMPKLPRSRQPR
jgi:uncharacterized membrane protein